MEEAKFSRGGFFFEGEGGAPEVSEGRGGERACNTSFGYFLIDFFKGNVLVCIDGSVIIA